MKKTRRVFIFFTFFSSGLAVILSLVALGTQGWVSSNVDLVPGSRLSNVQYGLFAGTYERVVSTTLFYELSVTCSFSENSCAMLCGNTPEDRNSDMADLLDGRTVSFDTNCPRVSTTFVNYDRDLYVPPGRPRAANEFKFINAGLWLSTIIFLIISCAFGIISTGLAVWNTIANPIEVFFNVQGMYVYNGIACAGVLITIVLWGAQFGATLVRNICILETIDGTASSDGHAILGYSYWLTFPSLLLYALSIVLLALRQHLINQQPRTEVEDINANDAAIILY